jgi:1,4-alpha-glucan branching enzyme
MGIRKMYFKNKGTCKVTFTLPGDVTKLAKTACIVGDFNNWDKESTPMKKAKDGTFKASVDLACGTEYQFRYLVNDSIWENDCNADRYEYSPYGCCDNSVVTVSGNEN